MIDNQVAQKIKNFFSTYPTQTFATGQTIAQPMQDLPGVLYIIEGQVNQYGQSPSGNKIMIMPFKAGAFFPMSWAINHTSNDYFFETNAPTTAHIVPPADAIQFLQSNPDVLFDLLGRVYKGTDGLLRRITELEK